MRKGNRSCFLSLRFLPIVLLTILAVSLLSGCSEEDKIREEIEKANYCDTKEDCIDAGGRCPFGCYAYVNQNEAERIKALIDSFKSYCEYGCMLCEDVMCIDSRCTPVCEGRLLPG